jgi:ATPase subunit of ABC transporter with duplicated ATPase domains
VSSIVLSRVSWAQPDGEVVLKDLDLVFGPERTGLIGRNGVGKSTVLNIIGGGLTPASGSVSVEGSVAMAAQTVQADLQATVADLFNLADALDVLRRAENGQASLGELERADWTLEDRIATALTRVGLNTPLDMSLAHLSGGQRTLAAFAAALFRNPDFLLLDEPTNNLDREGRQTVIDALKDWRAGAIVVSHDRELLELMDSTIELSSLGIRRYGGGWSEYTAARSAELHSAQGKLAHAQKELREIDRRAQRVTERQDKRAASGAKKGAKGDVPRILLGRRKGNAELTAGKSARTADRQRANAADLLAEANDALEVLEPFSINLPSTGVASGKHVLSLENVTAGYSPEAPVFRNLSFSLVGPQRMAIIGPNGSGKTTLLKLIAGALKPFEGTVSLGVAYAMLDQTVSILDGSTSILENFSRLNPGATENACRAALASFRFRADMARQTIGTLSGGQLLRAGLACVLGGTAPPSLLILDEPTNHLDIESIEAIEAALRAFDGALLLVSHDAVFLDNVGQDRRLHLAGNFSDVGH